MTNATTKTTVKCSKCNGRGRLDWTTVDNGRCFQCCGAGTITVNATVAASSRARQIVLVKSWLDADPTDEDYVRNLAYAIQHAPRDVAERAILAAAKRTTLTDHDLWFLRRHVASV